MGVEVSDEVYFEAHAALQQKVVSHDGWLANHREISKVLWFSEKISEFVERMQVLHEVSQGRGDQYICYGVQLLSKSTRLQTPSRSVKYWRDILLQGSGLVGRGWGATANFRASRFGRIQLSTSQRIMGERFSRILTDGLTHLHTTLKSPPHKLQMIIAATIVRRLQQELLKSEPESRVVLLPFLLVIKRLVLFLGIVQRFLWGPLRRQLFLLLSQLHPLNQSSRWQRQLLVALLADGHSAAHVIVAFHVAVEGLQPTTIAYAARRGILEHQDMLVRAYVLGKWRIAAVGTIVGLALFTSHSKCGVLLTALTMQLLMVDKPINEEAESMIVQAETFLLSANRLLDVVIGSVALLGVRFESLRGEDFIAFSTIRAGKGDASGRCFLHFPFFAALQRAGIAVQAPPAHTLPAKARETTPTSFRMGDDVHADHAIVLRIVVALAVYEVVLFPVRLELLGNHLYYQIRAGAAPLPKSRGCSRPPKPKLLLTSLRMINAGELAGHQQQGVPQQLIMNGPNQVRCKSPLLLLQEINAMNCSTIVKTHLIAGLMQQLRGDIALLHAKQEKMMTSTTAASETFGETGSNGNPEDEEIELWEHIDDLETRIIEMKQVSMHHKSLVECYDQEEDDMMRIIEIKRQVAVDLQRKIEKARSQLASKRLIQERLADSRIRTPAATPPGSSRLSHRAGNFLMSLWR